MTVINKYSEVHNNSQCQRALCLWNFCFNDHYLNQVASFIICNMLSVSIVFFRGIYLQTFYFRACKCKLVNETDNFMLKQIFSLISAVNWQFLNFLKAGTRSAFSLLCLHCQGVCGPLYVPHTFTLCIHIYRMFRKCSLNEFCRCFHLGQVIRLCPAACFCMACELRMIFTVFYG